MDFFEETQRITKAHCEIMGYTKPKNDGIRAYLRAARAGKYLLTRTIHELVTEFGLTALEAGEVIAADIRATVKEQSCSHG